MHALKHNGSRDESLVGVQGAKPLGLRRPLAAGISATLSGVGLQRFAYAPLLPAMVGAGWLDGARAGLLGAANLTGYLLGALLAGLLARALGLRAALRLAMLTIAACFALCAIPGGFWWFTPWRILAGLAGGTLMGLAGPAVQTIVPPHRKGFVGGLVLTGVGLGIMAGAIAVPALLPAGLPAAWLTLAAIALALAAIGWANWPDLPAPARAPSIAPVPGAALMIAIYALSAAAAAAQMIWWPDFLIRGLSHTPRFAGLLWLLYGAAAACGPALCGRLADRIGAARAFALAIALQAAAALMPLAATAPAALAAASALAGFTAIGCTGLALARAKELAGDASPALWRLSSACWGAAQAAMGFALARLYAGTGAHAPLFEASAACAILGAALAASQAFGLNAAGTRDAP